MDRGGTRSILKTHFEKEDLEGKTFGGKGIPIGISKRCEVLVMWRTAKVGIRVVVVVGPGYDCFGVVWRARRQSCNESLNSFNRPLLNLSCIPILYCVPVFQ